MTLLKFNGNISIDQVFVENRGIIYDSVLERIQEAYSDPAINEIKVITIELNTVEYSINLDRRKFAESLENAIAYYQDLEMYEKCQICVDIIKELKKQN